MVKKCIASGCFVIDKGKVLLVEHKGMGVWIQPGGHVDENEAPHEAAIREVKEETGLDVKLKGKRLSSSGITSNLPMPLVVDYTRVPYKDRPVHYHYNILYLAKMIRPSQKLKMDDESERIGWFTEKEAAVLKMLPNTRAIIHEAFKLNKRTG